MRLRTLARIASVFALAALVASGARVRAQSPEELARRHLELGLDFMQKEKYDEALKDLRTVVDSFATTSVAPEALAEIARYEFEVARDFDAAQTSTDTLLKKYSSSPAAAAAYVMSGRLIMQRGRTPSDVDAALASFDRVPALFPRSDVIPSAIYYAGVALHVVHRDDEALERYRDVTLKYPRSLWAARALTASAVSLVRQAQPMPAMRALQRVREQFTGIDEAAALNTILYRLYVRPPAQPPYAFSGRVIGSPNTKFKDVSAIRITPRSQDVLLAHKLGVTVFDRNGAVVKTIPAEEPSAIVALDRSALIVRGSTVLQEGKDPIALTIQQPDGKVRNLDEIPAADLTSKGDLLVSDRKAKTIQLFTGRQYSKPWAATIADRIAIDFFNRLDDVAVLDRDSKTVALFDRDGRATGRIPSRGAGWEFDSPADITVDAFGHVYVLDRSRGAVFVFTPAGKFVTSFSIPEKSPGAFQKATAFDIDAAGRLFIFDDRSQRLQVYQ